jgi:addiction module RelE/StbE family toxin
MRIVYAESALADLDEIYAYQTKHWPAVRAPFAARLVAIHQLIADHPFGAPQVAERPGVRVIGVTPYPYRIFYKVVGERIEVLRVHHASRRDLFE